MIRYYYLCHLNSLHPCSRAYVLSVAFSSVSLKAKPPG